MAIATRRVAGVSFVMLEGEEDSRKEQTAMMEMRQDGLEVAESGSLDEECRSVLT